MKAWEKFKEVTGAYEMLVDRNKTAPHVSDLERMTGLTKREREILDHYKLSRFKQDYQRVQETVRIFQGVLGISAGMTGSYAVYEQFQDAGIYGPIWMMASLLLGVFGFFGLNEAKIVQEAKRRDIETLSRDIEALYGRAQRK